VIAASPKPDRRRNQLGRLGNIRSSGEYHHGRCFRYRRAGTPGIDGSTRMKILSPSTLFIMRPVATILLTLGL